MVKVWVFTLVSVFVVSLVSFVGVFSLALKKDFLHKILLYLVSLSAGALLGGAFFHLIPEASHEFGFSLHLGFYVLSGIMAFFVLEKFICWRHCHIETSRQHPHPVALMNLVGDAFHNFIDGMVIAGTYLVSIPLGISTTLAVLFHEIPQEIGDFGVLVHGGFSRLRALLFNFGSALFAVLGALVILFLNIEVDTIGQVLVPFTAGGFLYIATSDLIPELRKDIRPSSSLIQLVFILIGLAIMLFLAHGG
ncbi:MAG: ZIP family metal transporter [Candidatus Margulisbacteria bacterium]|nr:ZIP family metal transporter [Candidatus Margulisiibacteriota bacterium]